MFRARVLWQAKPLCLALLVWRYPLQKWSPQRHLGIATSARKASRQRSVRWCDPVVRASRIPWLLAAGSWLGPRSSGAMPAFDQTQYVNIDVKGMGDCKPVLWTDDAHIMADISAARQGIKTATRAKSVLPWVFGARVGLRSGACHTAVAPHRWTRSSAAAAVGARALSRARSRSTAPSVRGGSRPRSCRL